MHRRYDGKLKELQKKKDNKRISKLEKYKSESAEVARSDLRKEIKKDLSDRSRHDEIVGKIGSMFLEEEIIEKTGYRLKTYEPLYEVPLEKSGQRIGDVLLHNESKNNALILEVKTGSLSGAFGEIKQIKKTVGENKDRLERIIGKNYSDVICDYGLVIDEKNLTGTLKDHIESANKEGIPLLTYRSDKLKLHDVSALKDEELEKELKQGIRTEMGSSTTITPNSHDFHILHNTLLETFKTNMIDEKDDPKEFSKEEFKETFFGLVTIRDFQEDTRFGKALNRRIEDVLEKGIEYGIIREIGEKEYKIYVRGKKDYEKLIDNLERKWINEYVERNWEKRAEDYAYKKFMNKDEEAPSLDDFDQNDNNSK
ncbi:MAG: hypothetical protein ACOC5D_06470 [Thermoplasmatota archaeon]